MRLKGGFEVALDFINPDSPVVLEESLRRVNRSLKALYDVLDEEWKGIPAPDARHSPCLVQAQAIILCDFVEPDTRDFWVRWGEEHDPRWSCGPADPTERYFTHQWCGPSGVRYFCHDLLRAREEMVKTLCQFWGGFRDDPGALRQELLKISKLIPGERK